VTAAPRLRTIATNDLSQAELGAIRSLMDVAFGTGEGAFGDDDWAHALGGTHFVLDLEGEIISHASVVERALEIGGRPYRTGYVESVATAPERQGRGHGTVAMRAATESIRGSFELGALGTGAHGFYQRLGWQTWLGPMFVRSDTGLTRTPEEEGYLLVLETSSSPPFELTEPISCEWRSGDVW
jgi:aminoglycoside 2'-N-acetyltransferase I